MLTAHQSVRPVRITRRAFTRALLTASAGLALTSSSGLALSAARRFADRHALSRAVGAVGERVWLQEPGIEGWFRFGGAPVAGLALRFQSLGSAQTMVVPSIAGGGVWNRLVEDAIRPEWFGAASSPGDDDTSALQAAIDALGQRGSTLLLEGDYTISRRLDVRRKSGFRISGPAKISASSAMPVRSDYQSLLFDHCADFEVADLCWTADRRLERGLLSPRTRLKSVPAASLPCAGSKFATR